MWPSIRMSAATHVLARLFNGPVLVQTRTERTSPQKS